MRRIRTIISRLARIIKTFTHCQTTFQQINYFQKISNSTCNCSKCGITNLICCGKVHWTVKARKLLWPLTKEYIYDVCKELFEKSEVSYERVWYFFQKPRYSRWNTTHAVKNCIKMLAIRRLARAFSNLMFVDSSVPFRGRENFFLPLVFLSSPLELSLVQSFATITLTSKRR